MLKIFKYLKSHLWFSLVGTTLVLFLIVAIIFQNYLKTQYYNYLVNETWRTERAVLTAASSSINGQLSNNLRISIEIALQEDLKSAVSRLLLEEENEIQKNADSRNLISELGRIKNIYPGVEAIGVLLEDESNQCKKYYVDGSVTGYGIGFAGDELNEIYREVNERVAAKNIRKYTVNTKSFFTNPTNDRIYNIAIPLFGEKLRFQTPLPVAVVTFSLGDVVKTSGLESVRQSNIYGYVTDEGGRIIYHPNREWEGTENQAYYKETGYDILDYSVKYFGWVSHIAIDTASITNTVNTTYSRGVVGYMIVLLLVGLFLNLMTLRTFAPIYTIGAAMKAVKVDGENKKIPINGTNELWQLADQYNEMVDALEFQQGRLKQSFNEIITSHKHQNEAEIEALESQINAHFLSNTLNAINYDIIETGNTQIATTISKLSGMLHYTFSKNIKEVTLGMEVEWLEKYLFLQKYRLLDKFSYEINVPKEYSEWPCCKLALQPFVENSILHGFEKIEKGGIIYIEGRPMGNIFCLSIVDNGCGMKEEVLLALREALETGDSLSLTGTGSGVGIRNVVTRMRMFYGKDFSIEIESVENKGTCFSLYLPLHVSTREGLEFFDENDLPQDKETKDSENGLEYKEDIWL